MTDLRKAAQQALEVLERAGEELRWQSIGQAQHDLRAALAEPEPVAWMKTDGAITTDAYQAACWRDSHTVTPLYAAPPQRHVKARCRYPDCVDKGPDGKCTRWLVGHCDGGSNA